MKKQLETLNGVHLTRQMERFPKSVGFISYIHLEKNRQITFGMEGPFRKKKTLETGFDEPSVCHFERGPAQRFVVFHHQLNTLETLQT